MFKAMNPATTNTTRPTNPRLNFRFTLIGKPKEICLGPITLTNFVFWHPGLSASYGSRVFRLASAAPSIPEYFRQKKLAKARDLDQIAAMNSPHMIRFHESVPHGRRKFLRSLG